MDETSKSRSSILRAIGILFGLATQIFFLITVCYLFAFLRDGATNQSSSWLAVDLLLALQFAVVHSWLLLPSTRSKISRQLPAQFYGSLFCVATCVGLWLVFIYWRTSSAAIWDATCWMRILISGCFYLSWATLFYSLKLTGFGYQTGWTQWVYWLRGQSLPRRAFVEHGSYRWLRHPVYLSFLGLIWFTPRMTADHAILTTIWTSYIFVGSYLKDKRLVFYLGKDYRRYASRVPGYPGIPFGPLAKWKSDEGASSSINTSEVPALASTT
jgi:protein-S-isoprenylcysteine O-methyltransferase Ste14